MTFANASAAISVWPAISRSHPSAARKIRPWPRNGAEVGTPSGSAQGVGSRSLIVGAGPAGLEAAQVLGKRGYDVTLAEAAKELGGRVAMEARLPGLGAWIRVRDYRKGRSTSSPTSRYTWAIGWAPQRSSSCSTRSSCLPRVRIGARTVSVECTPSPCRSGRVPT